MSATQRKATVLVTRPEPGASELATALRQAGFSVLICPTVKRAPVADTSLIDAALRSVDTYDWIVFASGTAVELVFERLHRLGLPPSHLALSRTLAGPSTGALLESRGVSPEILTPKFSALNALAYLLQRVAAGSRVLLPAAEGGRDDLQVGLTNIGVTVDKIDLYRTVDDTSHGGELRRHLSDAECIVTLASPSSLRGLIGSLEDAGESHSVEVLRRHKIVSIGGTTQRECAAHGIDVSMVAESTSVPGLVQAVERVYALSEVGR